MSNTGDRYSTTNWEGTDPLIRLASFRAPRDLSLGGIKPNKKIFTPNLNVTRNKNKGRTSASTRDHKNEDKNKNEYKNNKNKRNGPQIIKSSGVFSEGLGNVDRRSNRISYGREENTTTLERPTLRIRQRIKLDEEDSRIKKVVDGGASAEDDADFKRSLELDAPIKLPMGDGGLWKRVTGPKIKVKQEYDSKAELEDEICALRALGREPLVDLKEEIFEDLDLLDMLKSEDPTLILLQLPASLPGRGCAEDEALRPGPPSAETSSTSNGLSTDEKPVENKCYLSDLEEGRIGCLRVHRSGRVTFALSDSVFEVLSGVKSSFHQEVVSVGVDDASRSANLVSLGVLQRKLVIFPDWRDLLRNMPA